MYAGCCFQRCDLWCGLCSALTQPAQRLLLNTACCLAQIQDRLKIRKAGRGPDVMLSRQTMLNCGAFEGYGGGCDGGACACAPCTPHAMPFLLA